MAHHLDVVPIRPENECSVVPPAVLRPQAWSAIVCSTGFKRRSVKVVHLLPTLRYESKMKMGWRFLGPTDTQRGPAIRAQLNTERSLGNDCDANGFQGLQKKGFAGCIVAGAENDMVKHVRA